MNQNHKPEEKVSSINTSATSPIESPQTTRIGSIPFPKQPHTPISKPYSRHRISKARTPSNKKTTTNNNTTRTGSMESTITRRACKAALTTKLSTMRLTLCPLYPLPSGPPHPAFPATVLSFWLLSEAQLDSIARYYGQIERDGYSSQYPKPMDYDEHFFAEAPLSEAQRVQIKRRKFGKFIGLRGCETPLAEVSLRLELTRERCRRAVEEEEAREKMMPARRYW